MNQSYLGADVAQASCVIHLLECGGATVLTASLQPSRRAFAGFVASLQSGGIEPCDCLVVMEATGLMHLRWADAFAAAGFPVYVLNTLYAARRRSPRNAIREHKTDPVDAEGLAHLGRDDGPAALARFRYRADSGAAARHKTLAVREQLMSLRINALKSAHDMLGALFPEAAALGLSLGGPKARAGLARYPLPAQLARARLGTLERFFGDKSAALREAAADSFAARALQHDKVVDAFRQLLRTIDSLEGQIASLDRTLQESIRPEELAWLCSIPGVGAKIARKMLLLLPPDWRTWGNARQIQRRLQAYFGFDPRLRRSGRWIGREKCSKRGNRIGRCALYQAAFCAMIHDPQLNSKYHQLRARGKAYKPALVDLMRIQLGRIVAVLLAQRPFIPAEKYHA